MVLIVLVDDRWMQPSEALSQMTIKFQIMVRLFDMSCLTDCSIPYELMEPGYVVVDTSVVILMCRRRHAFLVPMMNSIVEPWYCLWSE